jgi:hypothetical protein
MSNRGAITKVTSDIILDDTIINADVKATANITRTKINEYQNLLAKGGALIRAYDVADLKYIEICQDGTDGSIFVDGTKLLLNVTTGLIGCYRNGVNSILRVYSSDILKYLDVTHDGTDGWINSLTGILKLQATSFIYLLQNISLRDGKVLYFQDTLNLTAANIYADATVLYINGGLADVSVKSANGMTRFNKTALNNFARIYASDGNKRITIGHDNTNGTIDTNTGDIVLNPATNINCNNKPLTAVNDITFNAERSGRKIICCRDFKTINGFGSSEGSVMNLPYMINSAAFGTLRDYTYNLPVTNGVTITSIKLHYKRNDALSDLRLELQRYALADATYVQMANVTANDVTGNMVNIEDNTITNPVIDYSAYGYSLILSIQNNNDSGDAVPYFVEINYTYGKVPL